MISFYKIGEFAGVGVTQPTSFTQRTFSYSDPGNDSISKGGPNRGYPKALGVTSLTSSLTGLKTHSLSLSYVNTYWRDEIGVGYYYGSTVSGEMPPGDFVMSFSDDLLGVITAKLKSAVYSAQAGFAGGVFLGELRETMQLIKRPHLAVYKATLGLAEAYKRLSFLLTNRRRFMRAWAGVWLQYVYAVRPLISEVYSLNDRIHSIMKKVEFSTVSVSEDNFVQETIDEAVGFGNHVGKRLGVKRSEVSLQGKALVRVLPKGATFDLGNFGLRLADFVPTFYELIPWSFMLDYFTNVNEVLNSEFMEASDTVYAWVIQSRTRSSDWAYTLSPSGTPVESHWNATPGSFKQKLVERHDALEAYTTLRWEGPSASQFINITALIAALLPLRKKR